MRLADDQPKITPGVLQHAAQRIGNDRGHHLASPFLPQTPLGSSAPVRKDVPRRPQSPPEHWWLQWATNPNVAFKGLIVPVVLYFNWQLLSPYVTPSIPNPFARVFLLSGYLESESKPDDPRYAKSYYDLLFLAYYVVFFSWIRQLIVISISRPLALYFGLKKEGKIDRFGEQFYALIYFSIFGAWGYRVMSQLPSYWYRTDQFWIDYPHWALQPELKRYYLMQFAYWLHQFLVLVLGLEKPRKDYFELVAHHFVTLWLVGGSYFLNFTIIGSAVYMSMDIPDAFFAAAKLLNYIKWDRAKIVALVIFIFVWTYFRHYLNIKILWSVLCESKIAPDATKVWDLAAGSYMIWWLPLAVFASILALQMLNLFWYFLIWRVLIRAIMSGVADDDRSDNEDEEPIANGKED